jgi:transcriptional regulator with XRE-family HTH domain
MSHIGENIAKLRGLRRMTQKEMAAKVGLVQPVYSKIEQKEEIDDDLLKKIANALEVSPEAIKNFNEADLINNISCHFNDNAVNTVYNFNPMEKIIELYQTIINEKDETIKNKNEVIELYKKQRGNL